MLYIIASVFYLICGLYLISKNKFNTKYSKKNKNDDDDENSSKSNDHDIFFSAIVFLFSTTLFLEYLVIKNPTDNHLYSILLFLTLYLFVVIPNLFFFKIYDKFLIKFDFVAILIGLFTLVTSYLLFTLNKYKLNSGLLPGNLMSWSSLKALTSNHLPLSIVFSLFLGLLMCALIINLFISEALLVNPIRYLFFAFGAGFSSVIVYFTQVKEVGLFKQALAAHNYADTLVPLAIFIASFSSVLSVLGL